MSPENTPTDTSKAFRLLVEAMSRAGLGIAEIDGELIVKIVRIKMLEAERQKLIDKLMQEISDVMVDASVDFPAGREAGPRIEYDDDAIRKLIDHVV